MKKCLIGFIIAIISIIPISKASALTIEDKEYNLPDLPTSNSSDYYTIAKNNDDDTYLIFFTNTMTINNLNNSVLTNYYSLGLGGGTTSFSGNSYTFRVYYYKLEDNKWVYKNYGVYGVVSYDLEKDLGITTDEWKADPTIVKSFLQDKIIYTNVNYFACSGKPNASANNCSLYFNNEDLKIQENLSYDYELVNNYYNINFYTENFNSNYKYQIKFDYQDYFIDITNYLSSGYYSYTLTKNSTLYMQVLNENNETIESKTMTFTDITYDEENYLPTANIKINYVTDENDMAKANITININNYSPLYYYKYSFNDIEDINIDIVDNKYSFETYQNGTIHFYIYNSNGDIVYETSKIINQIIDNGIYYYYEFEMSEFYNSEDNSINTLVFYYKDGETLENDHNVIPYFNFYLMGEDNQLVPFYITYSRNLLDVNSYSRNINFDNITSQFLPYEKLFNNDSSYNNNSYTAFAIAPYMDLTNYTFEDYNDYKLVIRTTKKISDNYFNFVGGVMLPQPTINNDINYESEYTGLIKMFKNAFNRFKSVIIEIFQHCTYFFNNVSPIIQDFFITVFVLILFIFLIRFIL